MLGGRLESVHKFHWFDPEFLIARSSENPLCWWTNQSSLDPSSTLARDDGCSNLLIGVEHDSNGGAHGSGGDVLLESNSDLSGVSVGVDDLAPSASVPSVVDGVLDLIDVSDSLSKIELSSSSIIAVLDGNEGLVLSLSSLGSSESGEDSLLVKSHWLSLLVVLFLGGTNLLCHSCVQ